MKKIISLLFTVRFYSFFFFYIYTNILRSDAVLVLFHRTIDRFTFKWFMPDVIPVYIRKCFIVLTARLLWLSNWTQQIRYFFNPIRGQRRFSRRAAENYLINNG